MYNDRKICRGTTQNKAQFKKQSKTQKDQFKNILKFCPFKLENSCANQSKRNTKACQEFFEKQLKEKGYPVHFSNKMCFKKKKKYEGVKGHPKEKSSVCPLFLLV